MTQFIKSIFFYFFAGCGDEFHESLKDQYLHRKTNVTIKKYNNQYLIEK